jgi:hypothetical protein
MNPLLSIYGIYSPPCFCKALKSLNLLPLVFTPPLYIV